LTSAAASADAETDARSRYAVALQEAIYSGASGLIWREAVYKRLHHGWELASIGGLPFLDAVARLAQLGPQSRVLEFGCGAGAACQYLARTTGCRATGVERNLAQYERAMARAADSPERERLSFVHGDLTSWHGDDDFDTAFLLDTLSLLPDAGAALCAAAAALRAGGQLFIADLGAGPRATSRVLERAFQEDGFCSLFSANDAKALTARSGFEDIISGDHTDQAIKALRAIVDWLENPPAALRPAIPADVLRDWLAVNGFYRDAFESRALEYRWWSARVITARKHP
jgi:SAM-dependent methyltransferase